MTEKNTHLLLCEYVPFPVCIVNGEGKILKANSLIGEVFPYDGITGGDIYALIGIKYSSLVDAAINDESILIKRNDKVFRARVRRFGDASNPELGIYFSNITSYEHLKELYSSERLCAALINVDNFDELVMSTSDENRLTLSAAIDKEIRQWATKIEAAVVREGKSRYYFFFQNKYLEGLEEKKFDILDDIREIETEADFPVTLSIGVSACAKTPADLIQAAEEAMELALGRGGDQAVVKVSSRLYYYGGKLETVEKGNKGKSRIIYYAMQPLITNSTKVFIMGHKSPDIDCFGASLGIHRITKILEKKDVYIVLNDYNDTLTELVSLAKQSESYNFISSEKAEELVDKKSLVFLLDTHRPYLADCPGLLEADCDVVIIDHHRRAEDSYSKAVLAYTEPYASSTCELVAEMLQFAGAKKTISKLEAEALLGGMTLDTNRFAVKTGVRTFEAASWLRRAGADTTSVKRFFQTDMDTFKIRAKGIAEADYTDDGIALSICDSRHPDAQIINSQVADELLTIKGIKASFVIGRNNTGMTVISARSLGEMNVQTIMEAFGGGGHLTTAGAQVQESPEEAMEKLREILEKFKEDNK